MPIGSAGASPTGVGTPSGRVGGGSGRANDTGIFGRVEDFFDNIDPLEVFQGIGSPIPPALGAEIAEIMGDAFGKLGGEGFTGSRQEYERAAREGRFEDIFPGADISPSARQAIQSAAGRPGGLDELYNRSRGGGGGGGYGSGGGGPGGPGGGRVEQHGLLAPNQQGALDELLGYFSGSGGAGGTSPSLSTLEDANYEQYYNDVIRDPLLEQFSEEILPQISRQFAGNNFLSSERERSDATAQRGLTTALTRGRSESSLAFREQARQEETTRINDILGAIRTPTFENIAFSPEARVIQQKQNTDYGGLLSGAASLLSLF